MKTIVFHAGTPKTASTFIQKFLSSNRRKLLEYNIDYLDFAPPRAGRFTNAEPFVHGNIDASEAERIRRLIDASPADIILISDEDFFLDPLNIRHPIFDDYNRVVIFYLRPPVDLVASWAGEFSRPYNYTGALNGDWKCAIGELTAISEGIEKTNALYEKCLTRFLDEFPVDGPIPLLIQSFDQQKFRGGNVLIDFLTKVGVPPGVANQIDKKILGQRDNEGETRRFLDIAAKTLEILKSQNLEHCYDEYLVWEVDQYCQSGDPRKIIETLTDAEMWKISESLAPVYEKIEAGNYRFEGFSRPMLAEQYGQPRKAYVPVDDEEIRRLVNGCLASRTPATKAKNH